MPHPNPGHLLEQSQWDLFWLPPDVSVIDRPELLLIHCPRPVPFLNMVLRARAAPEALPALVAEAMAYHRHATPRWMVTDTFDSEPLVAALQAAGYEARERHEARIVHADDFRPRAVSDLSVQPVDTMAGLRDQNAVMEQAFGVPMPATDESLAKDLQLCSGPGARVHRFLVHDKGGAPIASGSMTLVPALGFVLLWGGGTVPEARGKGAYSALVAARIERARALGATYVGLYARVDTSAPIVARQGFDCWGEMTWWSRAGEQAEHAEPAATPVKAD